MIIEFWKEGLNPITCYKTSREINRSPERMDLDTSSLNEKIRKANRAKKSHTRAVTIEYSFGQKIEFDTVVQAALFMKVTKEKLYAILNNHLKNNTPYKIYKS